MPEIGQAISHYRILQMIGVGGMGEVYRAKDQKLGRDVAIKVLPEEFARDADRVARFQREAKLLASLNHSNIGSIYGLEEADGTNFLVLELIEGDTLSDRLKHGTIPVEEALKLALQIAEALEAAHEKGVIHRDLKPANIKVTPDGKVKILDFGLAKAFAGDQAEVNLSNSPTLSVAATQQGVILGTAAYMSPEQASGEAIDKRTDIWAFGVVLFEMLTGRSLFEGNNVSQTLASVIKSEPEWLTLPPNLHPRIKFLLERCLKKEPKNRYHDIADARVDIQEVLADPSGVFAQPVTTAKPKKTMRLGIPRIAAAVFVAVIITALAVWYLKPAEPRQVMRFEYGLPEGQQFNNVSYQNLAVSPDGRQFVYVTAEGLCLRSLNEFDAKLNLGTDTNPSNPFFSPDGKWIGYFSGTDYKLKKIAVSGGAPMGLCDATNVVGASWSADDTIVYANYGTGIWRVSANGGTAELIVTGGAAYHPQLLPDGKSLLFTFGSDPPYRIIVQSLQSDERKELFAGDNARYIPTGHIVYALENNLFAVPFNIKTHKVAGGSVPVVEGVYRVMAGSTAQYAVSDSGTLVYMPGTTAATPSYGNTLVWVDRNGREEPLAIPPAFYAGPRISPDGMRVVLSRMFESVTYDTYVWDLTRKILTRLTFDPTADALPLWTPDGKRIAFSSWREANAGLYLKSADGTGGEELISPFENGFYGAESWSGDGKTLVVEEWYGAEKRNLRIGALSMENDRKWTPLLQGKYMYVQPRVSPDGQFLAYTSNESLRNEVYVCTFPDVTGGKWQVSTNGGDSPLWSRDGRELFFRNGNDALAAAVRTEPGFSIESPKLLFKGAYVAANFVVGFLELSPWDISPDGKRFLMMKEPSASQEGSGPRKINIVVNRFEELKERVPTDQ